MRSDLDAKGAFDDLPPPRWHAWLATAAAVWLALALLAWAVAGFVILTLEHGGLP